MSLLQYETFRARFEPVRCDDLKPGVAEWVGWEGDWQALWPITEGDGGSYVGDWACGPVAGQEGMPSWPPPFVWVPERDLRREGVKLSRADRLVTCFIRKLVWQILRFGQWRANR